ncbi:MAG TPA: Rid family hydrolase [Sphingobacteriaceae bacterium]|nr:Rid family hydrolase [Sphingobacteriaceae bacterium]
MKRKNISSESLWEDKVGYSRAVRIGNLIEISGTTASDGNETIGIGGVYAQTTYILNKIKSALESAGGNLSVRRHPNTDRATTNITTINNSNNKK